MTIEMLKPGLQTTVQAVPRVALRHLGVPAAGAADPLSLALANRLVGNPSLAPALELTLSGATLRFGTDAWFAVTGAKAKARLNGERIKLHLTYRARAGDALEIGGARAGARNYVAVAGGVLADEILGSASTYLPAGLGGHEGRALDVGDVLAIGTPGAAPAISSCANKSFRLPVTFISPTGRPISPFSTRCPRKPSEKSPVVLSALPPSHDVT